jgi:hypothetical protein
MSKRQKTMEAMDVTGEITDFLAVNHSGSPGRILSGFRHVAAQDVTGVDQGIVDRCSMGIDLLPSTHIGKLPDRSQTSIPNSDGE